jgi:hypothetical protein
MLLLLSHSEFQLLGMRASMPDVEWLAELVT